MVTRGLLAAGGALMTKPGITAFRRYEKMLMAAAQEGLRDEKAAASQTRKKLFATALKMGARRKN
jgi:hypothetical protein